MFQRNNSKLFILWMSQLEIYLGLSVSIFESANILATDMFIITLSVINTDNQSKLIQDLI